MRADGAGDRHDTAQIRVPPSAYERACAAAAGRPQAV
jgi:hypothetical protein